MMNSSAKKSGGGTRLWGVADGSLNAQRLRRKRFLWVNSCGSKRRFEGIWTDVSCIFDCTFALILISENCILIVEHVDCSPFNKLLGSGKRRFVEFPRFAFLRCLVSLPFRADGIDIFDILISCIWCPC